MITILRIVLVMGIIGCHFTNEIYAQESKWSPEHVYYGSGGKLTYTSEERGDIIPDFSHVGYRYGDVPIPDVSTVVEVSPVEGDDGANIQAAINQVAGMIPDANGFKGAVLLKKGTYQVRGQLFIKHSGIVLRGEGQTDDGTVIIAEGAVRRDFIVVGNGSGCNVKLFTKVDIVEEYVPVGRKFVVVEDASDYSAGERITLYRPGTQKWIHDIKMDQISNTDGDTKQWTPESYTFYFERLVTRVSGDTIFFRNPVVMAMETQYGGGSVFKCTSDRIENVGIEDICIKSTYQSETDEEHAWVGIKFGAIENSWARRVTSWYIGYAIVSMGDNARAITIEDCHCKDPKSLISGGHRYSFNLGGGSMILFKNCTAREGRHDFVSGSRVKGPNVFTNCTATNTHADSGPHHRWAMGTLYDMVVTDGAINVQDRDQSGSGHGWAGANQVLWNCKGASSACQSPWVSAKNYNFGFIGNKSPGVKPDRPDGEWVGHNKTGIFPQSLYQAQWEDRVNEAKIFSVYPLLQKKNDSTFILSFNMPFLKQLVAPHNFLIGGNAGFEGANFSVSAINDTAVMFEFDAIGLLPAFSSVEIYVKYMLNEFGKTLQGMTSTVYIEPDLRPVVTGTLGTVNNEDGILMAKSSKPGFIYLVKFNEDDYDQPYKTINDLEEAVDDNLGRKVEASVADSVVEISAQFLRGGYYIYIGVDEDGRLSEPADQWPKVEETIRIFSLYPLIEKVNDSAFILSFNMSYNDELAVPHNFEVSGNTGFEDADFTVTSYNDTSILFVFDAIGPLPAFSSIDINVKYMLNRLAQPLMGKTLASYTEPDLRPIITGTAGMVNNDDGVLEASSSKTGFIYLVKYYEDTSYNTLSELDQAVADNLGRKVEVLVAHTTVEISTKNLPGGYYLYMGVDDDGRLSVPANQQALVEETIPVHEIINKMNSSFYSLWSSDEIIYIQPDDKSVHYSTQLFDITGRLIDARNNMQGDQELVISDFNGILIVKLLSNEGNSIETLKLMHNFLK